MEAVRILLADDHDQVRAPMCARLSREPDLQIVAEAASSESSVKAALETRPNIVLIDPIMRDGRGLLALSQIAERLPDSAY